MKVIIEIDTEKPAHRARVAVDGEEQGNIVKLYVGLNAASTALPRIKVRRHLGRLTKDGKVAYKDEVLGE